MHLAMRFESVGGTRFSSDWSKPPPELWRREIGHGWSSFIAVGDYLSTQEQRGSHEVVTCYRAATGEEVWTNKVVALFEDAMGPGPRPTPTFDQGKLYTQGATGLLQCLDAATGGRLWQRDLRQDAGCKTPRYGFAGSPLVLGELVVVFTGGPEGKGAIAYHRASGDISTTPSHTRATVMATTTSASRASA